MRDCQRSPFLEAGWRGSTNDELFLTVSLILPRRNPLCIEKSAKTQLQRDPFKRINTIKFIETYANAVNMIFILFYVPFNSVKVLE